MLSHLESDAEKKRCDVAKGNVRQEKGTVIFKKPNNLNFLWKTTVKDDFASSYFYTFSLNKKFCEGPECPSYWISSFVNF